MISIRKLLADDEAVAPLLRVIHLLLQGIRLHAVDGNLEDRARFNETLNSVSLAVEEDRDHHGILAHAGTAIRALQDYNQRTSEYLDAQAHELQAIVKMLTVTIGTIANAGDQNVGKLIEIEQQVFSATELQDVRQIKARLAECLDHIRQEAVRQREETGETVNQLSQDMERTCSKAGARTGTLDEATKLPCRPDAEEALAAACLEEKPAFAVVMSVDRLKIYNIRFGPRVGDEVLHHFAAWIRKRLRPEDRMFRWGGTTLVALLPRVNRFEIVREELQRVLDEPFEYTVETASRGVLLPVSARWSIFPIMASPRLLFQKIDGFANVQGGRN